MKLQTGSLALSKLSRVTRKMHLQPLWKVIEADLEGGQGLCPGPKRACHAERHALII